MMPLNATPIYTSESTVKSDEDGEVNEEIEQDYPTWPIWSIMLATVVLLCIIIVTRVTIIRRKRRRPSNLNQERELSLLNANQDYGACVPESNQATDLISSNADYTSRNHNLDRDDQAINTSDIQITSEGRNNHLNQDTLASNSSVNWTADSRLIASTESMDKHTSHVQECISIKSKDNNSHEASIVEKSKFNKHSNKYPFDKITLPKSEGCMKLIKFPFSIKDYILRARAADFRKVFSNDTLDVEVPPSSLFKLDGKRYKFSETYICDKYLRRFAMNCYCVTTSCQGSTHSSSFHISTSSLLSLPDTSQFTNTSSKNINILVHNESKEQMFLKDISIGNENLLGNYHRDYSSQTKHRNYPKSLLDTGWECETSFGHLGGELQADHSSVKLIVPNETVIGSDRVRIFGKTHVDLQRLQDLLEIPHDEYIISPAAEYHLDANWKLVIKKHMVILLPVALPPEFSRTELKIYTFSLVSGCVEKIQINEKSKENKNLPDTYYEVDEKKQQIRIFTVHFSGVIACYHCGKAIKCPGFLQARIYGSNHVIAEKREVTVRYEIWDSKHSIKDFHQTNPNQNLIFLESPSIQLPSPVDENTILTLKLEVTGDESEMWECKQHKSKDIFPIEKDISISKLVVCCRSEPFVTKWVMTWKPNHQPVNPFQCIIDISDSVPGSELNEATYIDNIPDVNVTLPEKPDVNSKVIDILKATLTGQQVQEMCSRFDGLCERKDEVRQDLWNMDEDEFLQKWLSTLCSKTTLSTTLKVLYEIKAATAITAMQRKGLTEDSPNCNEDDGPQAMVEFRRRHNCRLPCENSDSEEFSVDTMDDEDETDLKTFETQI